MADLDIHNSYTLRNWILLYKQKIETGLVTLPATEKGTYTGPCSPETTD